MHLIQLAIDKQRAPQKGDLLLSEPFLLDDHFTRSVIYLCEHNEDGSFGFILNNTLDLHLHEFADGFPDVNVTVGFGGPVDQNQLFFLHSIPNLDNCIAIAPGIFMGGNYTTVLEMLQEEKITLQNIRFFIGYTGWAPEQLQQELDEKNVDRHHTARYPVGHGLPGRHALEGCSPFDGREIQNDGRFPDQSGG